VSELLEFLRTFMAQFAGGPGPAENNLVRFALPALFWAVLLIVAWSRQRHEDLPREKLLIWGFGLALFRELFLLAHLSAQILNPSLHHTLCPIVEPIEHALALTSVVVIAGAFLRYILDDAGLARRYLQIGIGAGAVGVLVTLLLWPRELVSNPNVQFHQTLPSWLLHGMACVLLAIAIVVLVRKQGWVRNVVLVALSFFFLGEFLVLLNFATNRAHSTVLCPLANSFHIWAVPLFGFVYFREQSIDKQRAEAKLRSYRDHLKDLVAARTAELRKANEKLQQENRERVQAEREIARRNAELAAQNAVAATISQSLNLDTILNAALERALAVLGMESGCIYLVDPNDGGLVLQVSKWDNSEGEWPADGELERLCKDISCDAAKGTRPATTNQSCSSQEDGLQMLVSIPLIAQGRAVGALTLGTQRTDAITPGEMDLLTAIGQQIGMAVENARLYRETERWAEGMALMHELSVFLGSTLDPEEIDDQITRLSAKLSGCPVTSLYQWDDEQQVAFVVSSYGENGSAIQGAPLQLGDSPILSQLFSERKSIAINDAQEDPRIPSSLRQSFQPKTLLCLPVWGAGKPLGFLFIMDPGRTRRWRANEIDLLEAFIDRAAVALEKAHLHKQLEWTAALEERQRIAAEMHDGLAQTLSYMGLKTDRAAELLDSGHIQQVRGEFRLMQEAIGRAARDVRHSIASLQAPPQPRQSLQDELRQIADEVAEDGEPQVKVDDGVKTPMFLPASELEQVSRVVQEALLNATRHAKAQQITVYLKRSDSNIELIVEDDGQGFDPEEVSASGDDHFGLSIMHARAARIGGQINIESAIGHGTRVMLNWPMSEIPEGGRGGNGRRSRYREGLALEPT
jgi:signal transduction histidine kinase